MLAGKPRPFPVRVYAVVDNHAVENAPPRPPRRQNLVEMRRTLDHELETKRAIDRANAVLDRLEARIAEYKFQIDAFTEGKRIAAARVERIKDRILGHLSRAHLDHADGFERHFETKAAPMALAIDNESLIPADYMRETTTSAPDKNAIKAVLVRAAGKNATDQDRAQADAIGGCHLTQKVSLVRR